MKSKFIIGETVLYQGEELEVLATQRKFGTDKFKYSLKVDKGFLVVAEDQLKKTKAGKQLQNEVKKLSPLWEEYKKLYNKNVPVKYKKDEEWLKEKIVKKKEELKHKEDPFDTLNALTEEQLKSFITEKGLDIDPADYDSQESLLIGVCEEMGIETPQAE